MFRSEQGFLDTWQLGSIVMKNYYTVYDMSPYDEGKNFIQIGVGKANQNAFIGNTKYNTRSPYYLPAKKEDDSSHVIAPWPDQYHITPDPQPIPPKPDPTPVPTPSDNTTTNGTTNSSASGDDSKTNGGQVSPSN